MFYINYTGTDYQLIDGLQYQMGSGANALRVSGDYPQDSYTFQGTVTDVNGCVSAPFNVVMEFNTIPHMNAVANQTYCNGETAPLTSLGSTVTGTTFAWTNSNTNIGLAANGNGSVPSFSATNTTNAPITATITVTPTAPSGCTGNTVALYTITVNPTPVVATASMQSSINNTTWTAVNGTLSTGYDLCIDSDNPYYYMDIDALSSTPGITTAGFVQNAFKLTGMTNSGAFFAYWAAKGVVTGATGWQGIMWNIINGNAPMFYINYTGTDYQLIDGLQYQMGSGANALRVSGDYPQDSYTFQGTVTDVNGCVSAPFNVVMEFNTIPHMNAVANQTYCNGETAPLTSLGSTVAGTTFAWTNSNPLIGLVANGTGDVPSFSATNTTNAPITATITVTPTAPSGCTGNTVALYTITVNPTPVVATATMQSSINNTTWTPVNGTLSTGYDLCIDSDNPYYYLDIDALSSTPGITTAGFVQNAFKLTGMTNSTAFFAYWAAKGVVSGATGWQGIMWNIINGNAPMFYINYTGTDYQLIDGLQYQMGSGTNPLRVSGDYPQDNYTFQGTVTDVNGCVSAPFNVVMEFNTIPHMNAVANQTYCNGETAPLTSLGSTVTGTTFAWTNSNPLIGLVTNGTGSVPSFSATNTTNAPITATITVTPTAPSGCTGNTVALYTITVNPTPVVATATMQSSINNTTWTPVNGTLLTGYDLCIDSDNPYYYLDIDALSSTPGITTAGFVQNAFKLTGMTNSTAFFAYWAAKGVVSGATGWQGIMWNIINGNAPMFYINYSGTDYQLIDGLQYQMGSGANALRVSGDYPQDIYTFQGTVTDVNGCVSAPFNVVMEFNTIPHMNAVANQTYCNGETAPLTSLGSTVAGTTFAWTNSNTNIGLAANGTGSVPLFIATNTTNAPITATITVTPTAPSGCAGNTVALYTITVNPTPVASASVTTAIPCNGSTGTVTITATVGAPTITYTFNGVAQVGNGVFTGIPTGTYSWFITDGNGCTSVTGSLFVPQPAAIPVTGTVTYFNSVNTIMNNVTVILRQGLTDVHTTTTNGSGVYSFTNVCPGTYDVILSTIKPKGGINSGDAAQVNAWGVSLYSIEKVRFFAGDVVKDNNLNSSDAGRILSYFLTNGTPPFVTPWTFWKTNDQTITQNPSPTVLTLTVNTGSSPITQNYYGLVTGDFNMSFVPGGLKSVVENVTLNIGGTTLVEPGVEFELPVTAGINMEVGAISLIFDFPTDKLEVTGVYLGTDPNSPVDYAFVGDELRIGWHSLYSMSLNSGEALLTLKLRTIGSMAQGETIRLSLTSDPLNELADGEYNTIPNAQLFVDEIGGTTTGLPEVTLNSNLLLESYPNPFVDRTTFAYSLPKDGKVVLEIADMQGSKTDILLDAMQSAGNHTLTVDMSNYSVGVYTATLRLYSNHDVISRTIKVIRRR